jgi:hypothetical protein
MITDKQYIICSAIWFNDGNEHVHQPKNIKTGFVIAGRRHHNCYITLDIILKLADPNIDKLAISNKLSERETQGFITSDNLFVNRREAYVVAKNSGQIIEREPNKELNEFLELDMTDTRILISEDIY